MNKHTPLDYELNAGDMIIKHAIEHLNMARERIQKKDFDIAKGNIQFARNYLELAKAWNNVKMKERKEIFI